MKTKKNLLERKKIFEIEIEKVIQKLKRPFSAREVWNNLESVFAKRHLGVKTVGRYLKKMGYKGIRKSERRDYSSVVLYYKLGSEK